MQSATASTVVRPLHSDFVINVATANDIAARPVTTAAVYNRLPVSGVYTNSAFSWQVIFCPLIPNKQLELKELWVSSRPGLARVPRLRYSTTKKSGSRK
jgi:hypothetical protein